MTFAVTNTFTNGTLANATDVNTNFTDIENAFNGITATTLTLPPIGSVLAWLKTLTGCPALSAGWVECNGQVLSDAGSPFNGQTIPDLNGSSGTERFLRGQTTSGGTGGGETHTHSHSHTTALSGTAGTGGASTGPMNGTYGSSTDATAGSSLPSYYEVVWIIRVK